MSGNRTGVASRHSPMRRAARLCVLLLFLLGACGKGAGSTTDSGVEGTVLVGPRCPVVQAESPCPDTPFDGKVQASTAGSVIATAQVDADGGYRIPLEPGTYVVEPVLDGSGPPTSKSVTVTVHAGAYEMVDLAVDSGIR